MPCDSLFVIWRDSHLLRYEISRWTNECVKELRAGILGRENIYTIATQCNLYKHRFTTCAPVSAEAPPFRPIHHPTSSQPPFA